MAKVSLSQTSFTSGELDPRLIARHDYDGYYKGAETLTNVVCLGQGGVKRRGGFRYINAHTESKARLVTFAFNVTQTYLLVFTHLKMYVYKDDVQQVQLNSTSHPYIVTPYTTAQLDQLSFTQSADTLIVVHNAHPPKSIVRGNSHATWTLGSLAFPYQPTFDFDGGYDNIEFTPSVLVNNVNKNVLGETIIISAAVISGTSSSWVFTAAHVGGMIEFNGGVVRITTVTNNTTMSGTVVKEFLNGNTIEGKDVSVEEPVWSAARGYPSAVTFHESRLWFGNSTSRPQTLWGSVIADFFNFDRGVGADDDSIDITLDTDQVNAIYHIISGRHLQVFTSGGEFYIPESPIIPSNLRVARQTKFGVLQNVAPISVDGATMYIQRNGKQVREFIFTYTEASYVSSEVNLLAPHIMGSGLPLSMASQTGDVDNEGNYLYVVNNDGTMGVFITNRAEKVMAWTKWITDGSIMDVAVVEDKVYIYVQRTIGGSTKYFIEVLDNQNFTDSSVRKSQSSSATVTGLNHLDGKVCRFRANSLATASGGKTNTVMANVTPSSGSIVANRVVTDIEIGINYDVTIKTMPASVTTDTGSVATKKRRISRVSVQLHESSGLKINDKVIPTRQLGSTVLGQPPEVFTGIKTLPILGYSKKAQVTVTQTDPLPLTLLGLTIELQVVA
tara:strand:- start:947 stop:2959 length:2013 start_codon:yes stop_codon:yes gene_type:complete